MTASQKTISIIIPVHNEALNAPLLYHEIMAHLRNLPYRSEVIYVDDGSRDNSAEVIGQLARIKRNVRLLQFSRNFGKEAAVSAGLHAAKGDAALIIDADFQHPPQLIKDFIAKWKQGAEVVIGVRTYGKSETWLKKFSSKLFYALIKPMAHTDIIPHATDFRLLDRKVINAFNGLGERNRMTRSLIDWLGFKRDYVDFVAAERKHGQRSYSYPKLVQLAMTSFTAYTLLPLKLAGYLGAVITLLAGSFGLFTFVEMFPLHDPLNWQVSNVTMLAILLTFLIGVVLACLGLVALYIAQIHAESTARPLYIISNDIASPEEEAPA